MTPKPSDFVPALWCEGKEVLGFDLGRINCRKQNRHFFGFRRMLRRLTVVSCFLLPCLSAVRAQEMDVEEMMKWANADTIKYHIVGEYHGPAQIVTGQSAYGDVADHVVIDLQWILSQARLVGTPTFKNTSSTVTNLRDAEPSCLPPVLRGDYEHYDLLGVRPGLGGGLQFQIRTVFPVIEVAQQCTVSRKSLPARVSERPENFFLPPATMLGLPPSEDLSFTPDKKSFVVRKRGWVWTITPSA